MASEESLAPSNSATLGILSRGQARDQDLLNEYIRQRGQAVKDMFNAGTQAVQDIHAGVNERQKKKTGAQLFAEESAGRQAQTAAQELKNRAAQAEEDYLDQPAAGNHIDSEGNIVDATGAPGRSNRESSMEAARQGAVAKPGQTERELQVAEANAKVQRTTALTQNDIAKQIFAQGTQKQNYDNLERALKKNYVGAVNPDGSPNPNFDMAAADKRATALSKQFPNLPQGTNVADMMKAAARDQASADVAAATTAGGTKAINADWQMAHNITSSLGHDVASLQSAAENAANYDALPATELDALGAAKSATKGAILAISPANQDLASYIDSPTIPLPGRNAKVLRETVTNAYKRKVADFKNQFQQIPRSQWDSPEVKGAIESLRGVGKTLGVPTANTPDGFASYIRGEGAKSLGNKTEGAVNAEVLNGKPAAAPLPPAPGIQQTAAPVGAVGGQAGSTTKPYTLDDAQEDKEQ